MGVSLPYITITLISKRDKNTVKQNHRTILSMSIATKNLNTILKASFVKSSSTFIAKQKVTEISHAKHNLCSALRNKMVQWINPQRHFGITRNWNYVSVHSSSWIFYGFQKLYSDITMSCRAFSTPKNFKVLFFKFPLTPSLPFIYLFSCLHNSTFSRKLCIWNYIVCELFTFAFLPF